MAHDIINVERENAGSLDRVIATIDITSTSGPGDESIDVQSEFGIGGEALYGASVRGQEDGQYALSWSRSNDTLHVYDLVAGGLASGGTDVGFVTLEFLGT